MENDRLPRARRALLRWYAQERRDLPWRDTNDPYRIWVSEVMLQQTQVATVIPYYESFIAAFPTPRDLAAAPVDAVLKRWEGLGYYARARNLHKAAGIVVERFEGRVPDDPSAFRSLPGVGAYICAAVQSIAFGAPLAVVDGNVKRVLSRLFRLEAPANHSSGAATFADAAERLLARRRPGDFNQAVMELGATVCRPAQPDCPACPLAPHCAARAAGNPTDYPRRRPKRPVPTYRVAVGVVADRKRLLITQRPPDGLLGGLWEFPGGKIRDGESPGAACAREIREEVGLEVDVVTHLTTVKHAYTHFKVELDVYLCGYKGGEVVLEGPADYRWIPVDGIDDYAFPKANHKFFALLKKKLREGPV